jgi:ubiquinone/menaquinone biosynthesis C-methylase UbiE
VLRPRLWSRAAAERGLDTVGIDLSPAMISEARQRFPSAEFRVNDDSFDAVVCPFGVLHLPEPDKAFTEAHRVLRHGGRYALTVWCAPDKAEFLGLAMKATAAHADMGVPLPPAPPLFSSLTWDSLRLLSNELVSEA